MSEWAYWYSQNVSYGLYILYYSSILQILNLKKFRVFHNPTNLHFLGENYENCSGNIHLSSYSSRAKKVNWSIPIKTGADVTLLTNWGLFLAKSFTSSVFTVVRLACWAKASRSVADRWILSTTSSEMRQTVSRSALHSLSGPAVDDVDVTEAKMSNTVSWTAAVNL